MTDIHDKLKEWRAIADAATEGPWCYSLMDAEDAPDGRKSVNYAIGHECGVVDHSEELTIDGEPAPHLALKEQLVGESVVEHLLSTVDRYAAPDDCTIRDERNAQFIVAARNEIVPRLLSACEAVMKVGEDGVGRPDINSSWNGGYLSAIMDIRSAIRREL